MTAKERRQLVRMTVRLRNKNIKSSSHMFKKPFKILLSKISEDKKQYINDSDYKAFEKEMKAAFKYNISLGEESVNNIYKILLPDEKKDILKSITSNAANSYSKRTTAKKVENITKTTRKRINNIVHKGYENGVSRKKIAKQLTDNVQSMTKSRALTIARTETANSTSAINHETLLELEVKRQWVHVGGGKTDREDHVACDGEVVSGDEVYSNGMACPHEDGAAAEDVVNCYCLEIMSI